MKLNNTSLAESLEIKVVYVSVTESGCDVFETVYDNLEEAHDDAVCEWNHLTLFEKKHSRVSVQVRKQEYRNECNEDEDHPWWVCSDSDEPEVMHDD